MAQSTPTQETMSGVTLPGNRTVEFRELPIPQPAHGQVLLKVMASSICGSDLRAIYRAHLGEGAEAYRPGTVAGHEPCGQVVAVGPGCRALQAGDRVVVYHISGCGVCDDCRHGDCSGAAAGRLLALRGTRQWGRCAFVGEGGMVEFDVSPVLIHPQITLFGSWVTSLKRLGDLLERLDRWGLHPEKLVAHRLPLAEASRAYKIADQGQAGKVCIVFDR